jgi:hypothetical protein
MKAKRFDLVCLVSERKRKILIWFGTNKFLLQADRFHFGLKILGRSKAI